MIGLPYILYLTSLGLVKGPKQTLWAPYNISKRLLQAKNEQKFKKICLTFKILPSRPIICHLSEYFFPGTPSRTQVRA